MLLILMYHRAGDAALGAGNSPAILERHFQRLCEKTVVIVPGEKPVPRRLNVCLTFDDAYADFYFHVFPLLQKYSLCVVLAVPTKFILDETCLSREKRLNVGQSEAMCGEMFQTHAPFCTWAELREMQASGLVHIASHSHSHLNMQEVGADVEFEAKHSQRLIEENLSRRPDTFIYPYGSVNTRARQAVRQYYDFDLRVGAALNRDWQPNHQPLCRIGVDNTPDLVPLLCWGSLAGLGLKMLANHVRAAFGKWRMD